MICDNYQKKINNLIVGENKRGKQNLFPPFMSIGLR